MPDRCSRRSAEPALPHLGENVAWLTAVLTATDLVSWTKLLWFTDHPELARCEIAAFRHRVLHVAARLIHIARGFHRLRAAFG